MRSILSGVLWVAAMAFAQAAPLPEFDFTRPETCREWASQHHITALRQGPQGLEVSIDGEDPYFSGPARDYPPGTPLWMLLKLKSDEGGGGQVFYFRDQSREENSARFSVEPGQWAEVRLGLPALGAGYRLRIDPPGTRGKTIISSIRFAPAANLAAPAWPKPAPVDFSGAARLRSGPVELQVAGAAVQMLVDGRPVAASHSRTLLGYVWEDKVAWLDLSSAAARVETGGAGDRIRVSSTLKDEHGATWRVVRSYAGGAQPGTIQAEVSVEVDRDRQVAFLPMFLMVAGPGDSKQQGLFAGLEYLDNEPSSTEADLEGPESKRQVPANHKITIPLMTIVREGRYAGLIWEHDVRWSALFDSPDRTLNTGGDAMGVLFPGCDGFNRREGSIMPTRPETLAAGRPLALRAWLIGGAGASVVPAVQHYVRLRGLPDIKPNGCSLPQYVTLAAQSWLDSKVREGHLFRHAVWQGFGAQPAADAAMFMDWLAAETSDEGMRARLKTTAQAALAAVPPRNYNHSGVSHVRYPVQSLVYGEVAGNVAAAQSQARGLLGRFQPDGSIPYAKSPNHPDYGRTHFAPDANGLTAQVVQSLLEAAVFSGDRALMDEAVTRLKGLNKFQNTVPRGAQTWEVPLHTPDILGSAHLVRAYTLGYEITGEKDLLDQALYWAWTGVPFVYLITPAGFAGDRPYGTIAVYGATAWKAPVWFGRPVQWCGLVYADALYRLVRHDPSGPWKKLADGITSVGVFYSWPAADKNRQGLLPDVWEMLAQRRDGPAINPGTVQANAARFYGKGSFYDFRAFRSGAQLVTVHAPGEIDPLPAAAGLAAFKVQAWPREPYRVLIHGLARTPQVLIDSKAAPLAPPHEFQEKEGRLILQLSGQPSVELR